jgi:hypothetical protein
MSSILRLSLLTPLLALALACQLPQTTHHPSRVGSGLLYTTGQAAYDAFFSDLHRVQVLLARAPEEERAIRQTLSQQLGMTEASTTTLLSDELQRRALGYKTAGVELRMEVEGEDAKDEADTSAQTHVRGTLSEESRPVVEGATAAARQALRLAARLRAVKGALEQLGARSLSLAPQVEQVFGDSESPRPAEVEQNLEDARRLLPVLDTRAGEVIDDARRLAERLKAALTTNDSLEQPGAPPLISEVTEAPAVRAPAPKKPGTTPTPRRTGGASSTAKPKPSEPKPAPPATDFEP